MMLRKELTGLEGQAYLQVCQRFTQKEKCHSLFNREWHFIRGHWNFFRKADKKLLLPSSAKKAGSSGLMSSGHLYKLYTFSCAFDNKDAIVITDRVGRGNKETDTVR
jgi:hypothetical protein